MQFVRGIRVYCTKDTPMVCRHSCPDRRRGGDQVGARCLCAACRVLATSTAGPLLRDGCSLVLTAVWLQESIKTKHPQLLYESKLYRVLHGGSALLPCACTSLLL